MDKSEYQHLFDPSLKDFRLVDAACNLALKNPDAALCAYDEMPRWEIAYGIEFAMKKMANKMLRAKIQKRLQEIVVKHERQKHP